MSCETPDQVKADLRTKRRSTGKGFGVMARYDAAAIDTIEYGMAGGNEDSLFALGLMHSAGRDAAPDLVQAHKWFNLAALRGNDAAKRYRMELALEMSKAEIAEAQRQAREWIRSH
jgi:TPR repeat protein